MRVRVVIFVLIVLALTATMVGCGGDQDTTQPTGLQVPTDAVAQAAEIIADALGGQGAGIADATGGGGTGAADQVEAGTWMVAPLNEAFLQSLTLPAVDIPSITEVGFPLGERPTSQDFLHVRGVQVPLTGGLEPLPAISGLGESEAMPASYDLREQGKSTVVKDQNPYGTCWSFATLGSLESSLLPGESWDLSEDNMVLTSGFDTGGDPYNWGGNILMSTAYLARWGGPVDEGRDAYGDGYTPAGLSPRMHVQDVNWIPPRGSPLDNANVKRAIVRYGGVYVAMGWYDSAAGSSYYDPSTAGYYYFGAEGANHAVLIVGWDDDFPADSFATRPVGDGAFIVKNSWGRGWADGGYFYVSYYDTMFGRGDPMAVLHNAESTGNYSGIYQYDPLGNVNSVGFAGPTGWFANVFAAQADSRLSAVGFYTLTPGTAYEVYAGPSLDTLTFTTRGTFAYMGYHTVTLPEPVELTRGGSFVVAVQVTSPGAFTPIAVEYPVANYSSAATAQPGQSYVSPDGEEWSDVTTVWDANANVCLKAYVTGR